MARRPRSNHPQNRGLIAAVSLFAIAVLAGVAWVTSQDEEQDQIISLRALAPTLPQLRPASNRTPGLPSARADRESHFIRNHRSRGAAVGHASVYRGDLVQVGGEFFRLVDINEVAGYAHCGPSVYRWPCGTTPQQALSLRVGGELVACYNRGYNAQNEQLGQCFVDAIDIGGWMVEQGMAMPASSRGDYGSKRSKARREGRGWWHTQK